MSTFGAATVPTAAALPGSCLFVADLERDLAIFLLLQTSTIVGFFAVCYALISRTAGPTNRGPAVALTMVFGAICMALTPWLLGTIADHYSFSYGIVAIGFTVMFAPLLLGVFH